MRHPRIKADGVGYYHVISRIVDRSFKLNYAEKTRFRKLMYRVEDFSGVRILAYCIMSNHFHVLLKVPEPVEIDEPELIRRVSVLYGEGYATTLREQWEHQRNIGGEYIVMQEQDRLRARMYDLSQFVKTLKQRYTISYNGRHDRAGTLWEGRFKSVLLENSLSVLTATSAYIDLNPIRAKLVADPKDYRFSSYGEAMGGSRTARGRLAYIHEVDLEEDRDAWNSVAEQYRVLLHAKGEEKYARHGDEIIRPGIAAEKVAQVIAEGGVLTLPEVLRCRVRYMTDGLVIGSRDFVNDVFEKNRHCFGARRRDGARKMRFAEWGGLCVARDLQVSVVHTPLRI